MKTTTLTADNRAEIRTTTDPTIRAAFVSLCFAEQDFEALCAKPGEATDADLRQLDLIARCCAARARRLRNALWNNEAARFRASLLAELLSDLSTAADAEYAKLKG